MKNIEKITCDGFTVFCHFGFINGALECRKKLVAILFDNKADQLLCVDRQLRTTNIIQKSYIT